MIDLSAFVPEATPLMMLGGGLMAFLSPCVLPMLPVYALYLLGATQNNERAGWWLVLRRCLGLACSFVLLFTLIGAGAGWIGNALQQANRNVLTLSSGLLMLLAGLWMLDILPLPSLRLPGTSSAPTLAGFWGAFFFGLLLALSWTPCITPVLASALILIASAENATVLTGMWHLSLFALGLCLPMLLCMLLYHWLQGVLRWLRQRQLLLRRIGGGLMIIYSLFLILSAIF